jgi:predicted esterase
MASLEQNQPHLESALQAVGDAVEVAVDAGVPRERVVVLGFSQGACLGSEWAVRNPARYGGIVALSGGLIGPDGTAWPERGSFDGTPALFVCDEDDPHVPAERVRESASAYRDRGAEVTARLEEGMGHTVTDGEVAWVRDLLDRILAGD